jgi:MOSC domain-containing protein YiiM
VIGRIHQVNTSPGGVPKKPVPSAYVGRLGLAGDGHHEPESVHGGPDRAVSIYGVEAIDRVAADGHAAFPGAFGENLTLEGIDLGSLRAGDRLRIGSGGLELELTRPAAPCQTIAHWFVDRRIARISPTLHPADARWYARVTREGTVAQGDRVEVMPASEAGMDVVPGIPVPARDREQERER